VAPRTTLAAPAIMMPWSAISQRGLLSAKRATRFGTASAGFGSVGVGEFDFWLAVGVVEGDGLTEFLFDDRPNFGYRSNGTVIDQLAEVSAIAIGQLR